MASKYGTPGIERIGLKQGKAERKQNTSSDGRRKEGSKGGNEGRSWAEATD
jgi:hypothetical protein